MMIKVSEMSLLGKNAPDCVIKCNSSQSSAKARASQAEYKGVPKWSFSWQKQRDAGSI